ncbi:MAG: NAD-dependent epimerase/dehydratase family protein [Anaerolineae bacterium]|nr:NAD-dependent epimerase/dehydratase family protein [Anaerolineae bacterium]NIN96558.1 NAD-dependent epimerase/dehydratase family protein [Anaerolineae bacterium]NIQ79587.1 NAD-dependent epimerase/dehydratase family protein [Anaerolineae bacterium]
MRALITGVTGFAGSHLAEYLIAHTDLEVLGTDISSNDRNIAHIKRDIEFVLGDISQPEVASDVLTKTKPDYIFHLAAQAFVPVSWRDPWQTLANNIRAQLNMLQALLESGARPRILIVGSADEYGLIAPDELPITEATPLRPYSPYAVSKIAQDMLGYQYYASHNLPIVRVRPFNHIGARQSPAFVTSDFARQIAEIEAGSHEAKLKVGNLDARRDFTDVRDMVRAYHLALEHGEAGDVYNLGAEKAYSIREVLDMLLGMSGVEIDVERDEGRFRPSDVPIVICDCSKFREQTGWRATIDLQESLLDVLNYWRKRIRGDLEESQ